MRLEGVDPSNPDRIVINIGRDEDGLVVPDSVMVSEDKGESFVEWTTVSAFGGITFSSAGEVWLGDAGDTSSPDSPRGIKHAASLADEPEVLADGFPVRCLHHTGDTLFVCQRFSFGTVSLEDGEFTAALEFSKVQAMAQCEGVDTAAVCRQQLCMGWCGTAHFASSPMCKVAYDSNEEVGCASLNPGGMAGTGSMMSGGAGGTSGAGEGGTSGAGEGGAGEGGEGGTSSAGEGGDDGDMADDDSGGCSCSTVGKSGPPEVALALTGLLLLVTFARRRRMS
jgi:MYXO-CTERM domain-containing protein